MPIFPQSLEASLQTLAALIPRVERKDTFGSLADGPLLKEHPASRFSRTKSPTLSRVENTVDERAVIILALEDNPLVQVFDDGWCVRKSKRDIMLM